MSSSRPPSNHVVLIDLVRFLAAALVLLSHLSFGIVVRADSSPYQLSTGLFTQRIAPAFDEIGWIGVQIFFVISGLVISYSAHNATPSSFVRSRLLRLMPAAWICAIITAAIVYYNPGFTTWTWTGLRHSLLLLPWGPWVDSVYWTLPIEIFFYGTVWLLIQQKSIERLSTLATALVILSGCYWSLYTATQSMPHSMPWSMLTNESYALRRSLELILLKHGSFFAIGILLCEWLVRKQPRPSILLMAAAIAVGLLQIYWNDAEVRSKEGELPAPALPMILWLGSIAAIVIGIRFNALFSSNIYAVRILRTLGLITYPLYLVHQNVGAVLMKHLKMSGISELSSFSLAFISVLAVCWLIVEYIEPPLRRVMGWLFDRLVGTAFRYSNPGAGS